MLSSLALQVNRKSQTIFHLDGSDSEDDPDLANQSLSQSMMRSNGMLGYSKSFQVPDSISYLKILDLSHIDFNPRSLVS